MTQIAQHDDEAMDRQVESDITSITDDIILECLRGDENKALQCDAVVEEMAEIMGNSRHMLPILAAFAAKDHLKLGRLTSELIGDSIKSLAEQNLTVAPDPFERIGIFMPGFPSFRNGGAA